MSCTPASGATFPIGQTTVTCTATDPDDTNSPVSSSFTVTVKGAAAQLADLAQAVQGVGPGGILARTVAAAQSEVASGRTAGPHQPRYAGPHRSRNVMNPGFHLLSHSHLGDGRVA